MGLKDRKEWRGTAAGRDLINMREGGCKSAYGRIPSAGTFRLNLTNQKHKGEKIAGERELLTPTASY